MILNDTFISNCPESRLPGKQMRFNEYDCWESVETGLQVITFTPYAAILAWRGEANFKLHEEYDSAYHKSLSLTKAGKNSLAVRFFLSIHFNPNHTHQNKLAQPSFS